MSDVGSGQSWSRNYRRYMEAEHRRELERRATETVRMPTADHWRRATAACDGSLTAAGLLIADWIRTGQENF